MNQQNTDRCTCTNCPGAACQCGCQSSMSAAPAVAAPQSCACGPACGCEGAEQGCLCR